MNYNHFHGSLALYGIVIHVLRVQVRAQRIVRSDSTVGWRAGKDRKTDKRTAKAEVRVVMTK